jgi:membrane protein implicated in regulation of membrane protease activity
MRKFGWTVASFFLAALVASSSRSVFAGDDCCTLLQRRVAVLEKKLAVLESAITVSAGSVTIRGTTVTIKADGEIKLVGAKISQN